MKKKIVIIHTGGTIAMSESANGGSVKPTLNNPLHSFQPLLEHHAEIRVDDYLNIPSPHITPQVMFEISKKIEDYVGSHLVDGIVLTHGTDTLEETAFMLDMLLPPGKPIVVTGAMRSSNELGADGPVNLLQAVQVATDDHAFGLGVLVVFNNEIHTARNVTKTHTSNIHTFQSPQYGPIGIVTKQNIHFQHTPLVRDHHYTLNSSKLTKKVLVLKMVAGLESEWIECCIREGVDGLVIEAFGQGNVPPNIVPVLKNLISKGVPVVLVSRCFSGIVEGTYEYEGGGKQLQELGVIFSKDLNGQKSRLKLMVALEITSDMLEIGKMFDKYHPK
jgi:L-asparaginase